MDRKEAKDREERQRSKRHTLAQRIIPPQYFDTDLQSEEFNHQLWQKVADFSFSKPRLWLGIVGESGSCKTRSACQKLKEEILRSGSGHFLPALELGNFASNQQTAEQREAFYNEKKKAKECALLVLDDLGKLGPTPTPARAKVLFEILEHRLSYNLPLIWTANLSLEETFRCYPEEYGPTTSGRLLEASHIIA
ncbi:MAG: ATP-binding protein [Akkermansiaceae bacterium]